MRLKGKIIECKTEKLLPVGGCLARYGERDIVVYNALPGETVRVQVIQQRRKLLCAVAQDILEASPFRKPEKEEHYLSCSPWQIMDFSTENFYKQQIAQEILKNQGISTDIPLRWINTPVRFYYRNKMEFSFTSVKERISLAFFKREQRGKIPIEGCILASPWISNFAQKFVRWLNSFPIPEEMLKSLILRSNSMGHVIAGLFIKQETFPSHVLTLLEGLKGLTVYYSDPRCPASVPTKVLYTAGENSLTEILHSKILRYGLLSFFQIHVDVFSKALEGIRPFLEEEEVVDYYSGVGSISIALSDRIKSAILGDICKEAITYAQENIDQNNLKNFQAYCGRAEKLLDLIEPQKVVILDPPRSGVHSKVLQKIIEKRPKRVVYLSCNIITCMENIQLLLEEYRIIHQELYNFFPAAPHTEFLVVLERKSKH